MTNTLAPASAALMAVTAPPWPKPTMTTSKVSSKCISVEVENTGLLRFENGDATHRGRQLDQQPAAAEHVHGNAPFSQVIAGGLDVLALQHVAGNPGQDRRRHVEAALQAVLVHE